ncbi:MAG: 3-hydroxyacyl-CoA dehydrogenase family protein [Deltaproteobacteria bacterium]|nr:3-hydroxyacyl-CoA dehydrogenase family protein [Deltaproteobacteria bacterium]MBW2308225.1 3-hydroxyacyl-CoA dehydrogenase family protein [Deltaproteobacteria bacterium]
MDPSEIRHVALIGSGTMGAGIAQTFARAGIDVFMVDLSEDILERALQRIHDNLDVFVELEVIHSREKEATLSRIHTTTDIESACRKADYFMEVVQEVLEQKQMVLRQADEWCPPRIILASNTSHMRIDQLASATKRPDRVVGTHWVNPPHIMQLVEIVKGSATSQETVQTVRVLLESIGKAPIVCKDTVSFLNNAIQAAAIGAALKLWQEGVATPEDIDRAVNTGFGFRFPIVGPLAFLDMAGLDNVRDSWAYVNSVTGGARGQFPQALQELIEKGHWGLKTGKGIYEYTAEEVRELSKERNRKLILQLKALGRI